MLHFLESFYEHARNTLIWFIVYFVLQAVVWLALGILVLIYPQILFVLVAIFFVVFAAINLYFMIIFIFYAVRLRKTRNYLRIK